MENFLRRESGKGKQLCSCQCHPDLSWIRFGDSRIHFTDVDCMFVVERKGRFLFIEYKEENELLTEGQRILLEQLSLVPRFTVLVLRGTAGEPIKFNQFTRGVQCWPEHTDRGLLQERISEWYLKANQEA